MVNLTRSRSHGELQQMKVLAANHPDLKVSVKCFFLKAFLNMLVFSRKRDLFLFPHNHKTILVSGGGQELEKSIIKKFKEQTKPDRSKRFQRSLIKKKKTNDTPEQLQRH